MARIFEEVKWGNLYFLKLQDPQGYIYSHGIGGDPVEEGNHWSDNIRGTPDDRKVVTELGPSNVQHLFITAQAHLAWLYRDWDAIYARTCLDAARRCFEWMKVHGEEPTPGKSHRPPRPSNTYAGSGTGARAGIALFKATGERQYLDYAIQKADRFLELQHTQANGSDLTGFFYDDATRQRGAPHIAGDSLAMIGFCGFVENMKRQKQDAARWEAALNVHCEQYLERMARLNAFGIVPYQVKLDPALVPGARSHGGVSYRYFMCRLNGKWWVGNNANLGTGVILCKAAKVSGNDTYRAMAQRMLDWILGLNPFDVSQVVGVGYKNPPEYIYTGFKPRSHRIPGSEICGIAGDDQDRPDPSVRVLSHRGDLDPDDDPNYVARQRTDSGIRQEDVRAGLVVVTPVRSGVESATTPLPSGVMKIQEGESGN
jgi:hypothetical protein